jgi:uncharacterized membrane-anchored protein
MAWIESHQGLGQHPKTKRLARALQISLPAAVGHLQFLWWWALDYAQDGDLSKYTNEDIADAICWDGDADHLADALVKSGFADRSDDDGTLSIHDWYEYAGRLIEQRQANRDRAQRARQSRKRTQSPNGTHTVRERAEDATVPYRATVTLTNHIEDSNESSCHDSAPAAPDTEPDEQKKGLKKVYDANSKYHKAATCHQ